MPDFGFDGVSSSLPQFMSIKKKKTFNMYVNPDTTDNTDSTRAMHGVCFKQLATTQYTPAAFQQMRRQHRTRAVVCPRCITASSFLFNSCLLLLSDPAISRPAGLCCCVIHVCRHRH